MKEKLTNNIVLKITSVLFAIAVWLVVLNINDPNKVVSVSGIPVEIINDDAITSKGKAYSVKSGGTCTISISGPRSIVDTLDEEDFSAVADVNDLSITNSVPIEVELEKNTYKSKVDITVKTTLKLEIEDVIENEYDIEIKYSGKATDNYVVTGTELDNPKVTITAPHSQMEKIKSVVTTIDISDKVEDFDSTTEIKLLDLNNREIDISNTDIKLSNSEVDGTSRVLYKKELSITCELPEMIDYNTLVSSYELSTSSITVVGKRDVLDGIDTIELPIELDEYSDTEETIELKFDVTELLPEGVYNYTSTEQIELNIFVNERIDRVITTKAKNISISNIPDGLEASLVTKGDISYTIRGLKELVEEIDDEDIILKVDVGELQEGTHSLEVQFTLPEGIELLDEINVEVNLAAQEEETTPEETTEPPTEEEETTPEETTEEETPEETSEEETTPEETTEPSSEEEITPEETTEAALEETTETP